jgi:hypothetical protein
MGKASSNKKVARAAGTGGGRTGSTNTPWAYVGLIALVVVVGVALTWVSRSNYESRQHPKANPASVAPKVGGTAWNEGFAVYICGAFEPPIKAASDPEGLTTDGNGVMHIAPKVKAAAGANATLGEFAKSVGMTLTSKSITLPGGKTYANGDKCNGTAAQLYVKEYVYAGQAAGTLQTVSPPDVRLANGHLLTIAFVAPANKGSIPPPPSSVQKALTATSTTTTTATTSTTSTVPSSTTSGGSTTTSGSSTTTVAQSSTTTVAGSKASKSKKSKNKGSATTTTSTTS